ncbi:hypothetical protein VNO77_29944 [Canavalia gladiata]|uniref:Uncharacterized protein n=1 Tax=Canavalia gladiata TaxID=3824 RepID=A0AAN9KMY8_CANGL
MDTLTYRLVYFIIFFFFFLLSSRPSIFIAYLTLSFFLSPVFHLLLLSFFLSQFCLCHCMRSSFNSNGPSPSNCYTNSFFCTKLTPSGKERCQ